MLNSQEMTTYENMQQLQQAKNNQSLRVSLAISSRNSGSQNSRLSKKKTNTQVGSSVLNTSRAASNSKVTLVNISPSRKVDVTHLNSRGNHSNLVRIS